MEYRYTKHQVARGARADAERQGALYLLKNVSELRLTYQIRLLTYRASEIRKKLVVRLPKHSTVHYSLRDFCSEHRKTVRIERV